MFEEERVRKKKKGVAASLKYFTKFERRWERKPSLCDVHAPGYDSFG